MARRSEGKGSLVMPHSRSGYLHQFYNIRTWRARDNYVIQTNPRRLYLEGRQPVSPEASRGGASGTCRDPRHQPRRNVCTCGRRGRRPSNRSRINYMIRTTRDICTCGLITFFQSTKDLSVVGIRTLGRSGHLCQSMHLRYLFTLLLTFVGLSIKRRRYRRRSTRRG